MPNSPVNPAIFVGRLNELPKLESHLIQTRSGNPSNFIITGERGIGKSSLLSYLKIVAKGKVPIDDVNLNFLVIETDIDQSTTQIGLLKKIELGLKTELGNSEATRTFLGEALGVLKRVEAGGFKLRDPVEDSDIETLIEEFSYSLAETTNRLCAKDGRTNPLNAKYDGVLVLVDEADNGSKELALGSFFKLLLERLRRRDCHHVMVGLAGLPNLRDVLLSSHESSLRLFEEIILGRLSGDEVQLAVNMCLKKANQDSTEPVTITDEAMTQLRHLSEGYPHFIQQFGYSAFAADTDGIIDEDDVRLGAFEPRGAIDLIGDRYYRDDFYNKIQQDSYRQVLRIMSNDMDGWVTKKQISKSFKGSKSILDNAIRALKDRHIVLPKEGVRGTYRLQHKGFAYWIALQSDKPS